MPSHQVKACSGDGDFKKSECVCGGTSIFDNAIVGYKCMHRLRSKKLCPSGYMRFKLDMSKAYDWIEWPFLEAIMDKLRFSSAWITKVMNCVTSASFLVLVNGHIGQEFKAERGLRQGWPLSPFLFILCAEGLSSLVSSVVWSGEIKGLKVAHGLPVISHLFFVDDSLLFVEASDKAALAWKQILCLYERASG